MSASNDPGEILSRYFTALQECRWEDAAACFTEDAFYSHPAFPEDPPGSPRREAKGRAALVRVFEARGQRKGRQRVEQWAAAADRTYISGLVFNPSGEVAASFVSELTLAEDGRIATYAAYSSRPPIGAALAQQAQQEGASR